MANKNFLSNSFPLFYHKIINYNKPIDTAEYWDNIYQYEWDSTKRVWPTKNKLLKKEIKTTSSILDIACGTGSILRYLSRNGYNNLFGTEISDLCIKRLENLGISMFKSNLPKIECPSERFDVVIASQILEHIIKRGKFLNEINRVLKPEGVCFLFVPDNCLGPIDEPSHVVKFNEKSLARLLSNHFSDYSITSIYDDNFSIPILYAKIRKVS